MPGRRTPYDDATALVVVDVQNDFAHPEGGLYVSGGEEIVPAVNDEVRVAQHSGGLVIYTQDWHPETTPHFAKDGGIWPTHCVQGTWGAGFHDDLDVSGTIVRKGTGGEDGYSGFTVQHPVNGETQATGLDDLLRQRAIQKLVVVGLAQDVCVKETVLEARSLGYQVTVLTEAMRPVNLSPGDGHASLRAMRDSGARIL